MGKGGEIIEDHKLIKARVIRLPSQLYNHVNRSEGIRNRQARLAQ